MIIIFLIYTIAGYWAVNKVIYEGKVVIYSNGTDLFIKKLVYAWLLGWVLIPIAILKCVFAR